MLLDAGVTVTVGVTGPDDELLPLLPHPFGRKTTQIHPMKKRKRDFI
jgi:hypothetical protein